MGGVVSELQNAVHTWFSKPTPRTHGEVCRSISKVKSAMNAHGMEDTFHEVGGFHCPNEMLSLMKFLRDKEMSVAV